MAPKDLFSSPDRDRPEEEDGDLRETDHYGRTGTAEGSGGRRRFPWAMLVVVALFVILPFLSWYGTWFGRPLSDTQIEQYLHDSEKPRHVQHALEQIVKRTTEGDQTVKRWYPAILSLAEHPTSQVRSVAAWAMGQDNSSADFHRVLLTMLGDADPDVRHNAALSLVRFGDATGRAELVRMLEPVTLRAGVAGKVSMVLREGTALSEGAPVARIRQSDGQLVEVRAPQGGHVERVAVSEDSEVTPGIELVVLSPGIEQVWEALRGLYFAGQPEDIPIIQRYTRDVPGMPDRVRKQAAITSEAIRGRASRGMDK